MKSHLSIGFFCGGSKIDQNWSFRPPHDPLWGVPGGGPRVHSGDSARKFKLVWESPLGFAFSDRNPTNLTKNAKKVSFGPNSPLNDMNFSIRTKSGQNGPKYGQFWSLFDPLGPPQTPTPPSGPKKHEIFDFYIKTRLIFKKVVFFWLFSLILGLSDLFSLIFPNDRFLVPTVGIDRGFFLEKRVLGGCFLRKYALFVFFRFFWLFLKKTRKKTPSKTSFYVNISYKKQRNTSLVEFLTFFHTKCC